jgi:hypothetical protein
MGLFPRVSPTGRGVEAANSDEAFNLAVRLLLSKGWQNGQIVDDGVRLLPPDEAEDADPEPVDD